MPRVAFTTFAILKQPYGTALTQGYDDVTEETFQTAERSPGFLARAKEEPDQSHLSNFSRDWGEWGKFDVPRFYTGGRTDETDSRAGTLSVWTDIASVSAYVYAGFHKMVLRRRHEWFLQPEWPSYAMWWVPDDTYPTWTDASFRLEHLWDHGPSPVAFDFHRPFGPDGAPLHRRPA